MVSSPYLACIAGIVITAALARAHAGEIDFNRDIRPILAENCFYCHGQDGNQRQANLRLDDRQAAIDAGALVPHDAASSELLRRVQTDNPAEQMPPVDSNRRLSSEQKALLERWVSEGAEYAPHWAFAAPEQPAVPEVKNASWARNPIDRFVLARLEAEDASPAPEADRETLIKRLYADLVGLAPTPDEVDQFVADADPDAYEKVVDRLFASPHYGERMALPWLDAARYADSNGFQQDGDTWQWIWRDWLVKALNDDMPFDQFTIWQLAGDLLPNATNEQKVASGFNRNHLLNGEGGAIAEEQHWIILFDRVDTTATTWLGLTVACAQCHDHKYDPITQRDYYSLLDMFNRAPESGVPEYYSPRIRVGNPVLELPTPENQAKIAEFESRIASIAAAVESCNEAAYQGWRAGLSPRDPGLHMDIAKALQASRDGALADEELASLEAALRTRFSETVQPALAAKIPAHAESDALKKQKADYVADNVPRVMVMSDAQPRETKILARGDYLQPGETVSFASPAFLPAMAEELPANRLGFANWLVAPEHPLTARVQVNRMWQHFFGVGLVKTSEDFGVQSEYPIRQSLLDWLAVEFRTKGWSVKGIQRLIVTSATYRQSSRFSEDALLQDGENRGLARAGRFRMPAPILRDWALSAAGLLDRRIGGAPVYPYQPEAVWESLAITQERDFTYPTSQGADLYRRSLYTFWRRTVSPANMFDASNRQSCRVRSSLTNTPLHALTTLNDPTWVEASRALAEQCMQSADSVDDRIGLAFRRITCRRPTDEELLTLRGTYAKQLVIYQEDHEGATLLLGVGDSVRDQSLDVADHAALTAICLAVFNLDESLTRE